MPSDTSKLKQAEGHVDGTALPRLQASLPATIERLDVHKVEDPAIEGLDGAIEIDAVAVTRQAKAPNDNGYLIEPEGFDVSRFLKNARLYADHDRSIRMTIGHVTQLNISRQRITFKAVIPHFKDELREAIRLDIERGLVKGISIGFFVQESEPVYETREVTDDNGEKTKRDVLIGLRVTKGRLLEISVVGQGADEDALIRKVKSFTVDGAVADIPADQWVRKSDDTGHSHVLKYADAVLLSLATTEPVVFAPVGLQTANPDDWKAIPYSKHGDSPKASIDTAWNGPKVKAAASVEQLAKISVFEDKDSLDTKSGYKGPHHEPGGKVVWNGVRAAMGVLLGARGGYKGVDDVELRKGYAHLAKHYKQFDKPAPEYQAYDNDDLLTMASEGIIILPGHAIVNRVVCTDNADDDDSADIEVAESSLGMIADIADVTDVNELHAIADESRKAAAEKAQYQRDIALLESALAETRKRRLERTAQFLGLVAMVSSAVEDLQATAIGCARNTER